MLAKGGVDHGLVTSPSAGLNLVPKPVKDLII
jgi:hypothetical protein